MPDVGEVGRPGPVIAAMGGVGLPEPLRPSRFPNVHEWLQHLEWQYREIVGTPGQPRRPGMTLRGKPIVASEVKCSDGRDERFWHLITDSTLGRQRTLRPGRASIVGQVWALLTLFDASDIRALWWRERRNVCVAPVDFSILVVLVECPSDFYLVTAYPTPRRTDCRRLFTRCAESWERGESRREDPPGATRVDDHTLARDTTERSEGGWAV